MQRNGRFRNPEDEIGDQLSAEGTLAGRTLLISGGSRGIGLAIALRAAQDGANVALIAKTATPHPKLEGTVYTAARDIEQAGGNALPIVGDVRDDEDIFAAVSQAVAHFGGIDICVNNASAIDLAGVGRIADRLDVTLTRRLIGLH
jgi:citronellol/citronellal dehydrogenase